MKVATSEDAGGLTFLNHLLIELDVLTLPFAESAVALSAQSVSLGEIHLERVGVPKDRTHMGSDKLAQLLLWGERFLDQRPHVLEQLITESSNQPPEEIVLRSEVVVERRTGNPQAIGNPLETCAVIPRLPEELQRLLDDLRLAVELVLCHDSILHPRATDVIREHPILTKVGRRPPHRPQWMEIRLRAR